MNNTAPEMTTDETFAAYLAAQGVKFSAICTGETKRDGWTCDGWRVRLDRIGKELATDYFTGTGHRKPAKGAPRKPASKFEIRQWELRYLKPTTPTAASVLHSLLLDSQGAEQPFDYWAADYGYDTDSIKALNIYNACCEIRRQVNAFFTHAERETLRTMLEDY